MNALRLPCFLLLVLSAAVDATSQPARDLGTLGGAYSNATAISSTGEIAVGYSSIPGDAIIHHPFVWTASAGMIDLAPSDYYSEATGVNASGLVVGFRILSQFNPNRCFMWTRTGGMVDLGLLGGLQCAAYGVNDQGVVVGTRTISPTGSGGVQHAFFWTSSRGVIDLGTLGGTSSWAYAINDVGQIVGLSDIAGDAERHAFSWTPGGGMVDLGTLGGPYSSAQAVNNAGQVVGYSSHDPGDTTQSRVHAFLWTASGGMEDLGTLGGAYSIASAVGRSGEIVGLSYRASGGSTAFSWTPGGGMREFTPVPGVSFGWAFAISDSGQVAGAAVFAGTTASHAAIWTTAACVSPAIATQPAGRTVPNGTSAILTVTATGTSPLTYQWYSGSTGDTSNPIANATSPTYVTAAATAPASYWVRVSNQCGSANSVSVAVSVQDTCSTPKVTLTPTSQTITKGQTAVLTALVTGTGPFTYQWFHGNSGNATDPIVGATSSTYSVLGDFVGQAVFWVRVNGKCGPVLSATSTVSVTVDGKSGGYQLHIDSPKGLGHIGSPYSVSVQATKGGAPLNGVQVTLVISGPDHLTLSGQTGFTGYITFTYTGTAIGRDTIYATAPLVPRDLVSNTITVGWIEPPPLDVDLVGVVGFGAVQKSLPMNSKQLQEDLLGVLAEERISAGFDNSDTCYWGATDAGYVAAVNGFTKGVFKDFGVEMVKATLDVGSLGASSLTQLLLKGAGFLLDVTTTDEEALLLLKVSASNVIGYVGDFGPVLGKATDLTVEELAHNVFKHTSVVSVPSQSNQLTDTRAAGAPLTTASVRVAYSSDTHFAVAALFATCSGVESPRTYVLRYEVRPDLRGAVPGTIARFRLR